MKINKFITHQYSKLMHSYFHRIAAHRYIKRYKYDFDHAENFVIFLGYPRSGHTLLGAMLNAHPDTMIAHEYHALKHIDQHENRYELFAHLMAQHNWFASRGHKWTGYSYKIPSGWQGGYRELKVIGDKRGGASSRILYEDPNRLERLQALIKIPVKVMIVHRNPFDNIATRARGGNYYQRTPDTKRIDEEIIKHFRDVETINSFRKEGNFDFLEMKHEHFVENPQEHLLQICDFLNLKPEKTFIEACLKTVRPSKSLSRNKVFWTKSQIQQINELNSSYDFLKDYTFEP
ncbi:MAG: sulfotransferase [Bacteroidales bacterium]|nr:sulfotransferase [Bacteroidales bacterium]